MTQPRIGVVGTGVIGAMAAWRLAARGLRVIAFDRYAGGHDRGASAGESRIFRTIYKEGGEYVPLLLRAGELWRELEKTAGRDLLTRCGGLTIGAPDHPDLVAVRACAKKHDLPHEVLSAADAAERFPQHRLDHGEIAVLDPNAGVLRPEPSVQAALAEAARLGAEIRPYSPVTGLDETATGWRITTGGTTAEVDHLVLAPGPWARETPLLHGIAVEPRLITACWFAAHDVAAHRPERLPIAVRRHPEAGFSCFPVLDGVGVKIVPHHLGWPAIDGPESLPRNASVDFLKAASAAAARLLPGVRPDPVRVTTFTEGFTPDDHAIVGAVPRQQNTTVLTGFSGHGFKLAPVFGEIAADLAEHGTTRHDLTRFAPSRFA
ncbi:N-methyl-L-tryptophan oxidase [Amycolatopsis sp. CA-230715]|uniref:N-methyl-L-tryptophan oxidase n=1 Tax=Amycolatopsis sp. CA-230715 TaxID=2745196 RepID=UPI001C02AEFD|nr:N-methyl-L-tryptophan oxidase [Amycolatopsis sp. CA-230715]QWF78427.1 Monomeric sarcosine oxidase [Amycolatopsis sp. CA-230715]